MISSVYIHVPFCRFKCPYCDFYSETDLSKRKEYASYLVKETQLRSLNYGKEVTIYFGGGTPSVMNPDFFSSVILLFPESFETTVEINPEDASLSYLRSLKSAGVNRVSIGVQTFNEKLLSFLGRLHSEGQVLKAIENAVTIFDNVSVDIIYGIPSQSISDVEEDIRKLSRFDIEHVSIYGLTYYEGTPFAKLLSMGRLKEVEESIFRKMYYTLKEMIESLGFSQYEVSNFAKSGFECKHNLTYWDLESYVGFGPSAASFFGNKYIKNVSDLGSYLEMLDAGMLPAEEEVFFSDIEVKKLKLAMGLRLVRGVDLHKLGLKEQFDNLQFSPRIKALLDSGYVSYSKGILKVKPKGYFTLNFIEATIIEEVFR